MSAADINADSEDAAVCGETEVLARRIIEIMAQRGWTLATAESCTGGRIAAALTAIPGSSAVFLGGVVAYANDAKHQLLAVSAATLAAHGAVSPETAREMARGARAALGADYAVSSTGIAGPGGATPGKPVGLVYIGLAARNAEETVLELKLSGNRELIQSLSVKRALLELQMRIEA